MNSIVCPNCNLPFDPGEAILHAAQEKSKEIIALDRKKIGLEERKKVEEEFEIKLLDSKKESKEKDERYDKLKEDFLKSNELNRELKEKDKEREIEMKKWQTQEGEKIAEKTRREEREKAELDRKEDQIKMEKMQKKIEELSNAGVSKSQQLQGEALEVKLLEMLKNFPDEIVEIAKGVSGADIRQIVKSPKGYNSGVILWECKRTDWSEKKFIEKLKSDQRAEKANLAVIVTNDLPKDANDGFINRGDDIWVCSLSLALPLAVALRKILLDAAYQKALQFNRGEKKEQLFSYITSPEFSQPVKTIVEIYKEMLDEITSEEVAFQRKWKLRKSQAQRIIMSMADIVGSIQGKIGASALQIKELELLESGEDNTKKNADDENDEQALL